MTPLIIGLDLDGTLACTPAGAKRQFEDPRQSILDSAAASAILAVAKI